MRPVLASTEAPRGLGRAFTPGRSALIAYVMGGYPDRAGSLSALDALASGGADVIELGVPYGDPVADGPVIAEAGRVALAGGFGLAETIDLAGGFLRSRPDAPPVALMTYLNPMMRMGFEHVAAAAAEAGVSGFIVPDLPPDQPFADRWLAASEPHALDTVFLAAPTSTPARLDAVGTRSRGFVYVVSSLGVTGERASLSADLNALVMRVREHTSLPIAVGFGVGTPEQVAEVATIADGVVVGSAIVRRQGDAGVLGAFVRELAEAL
ncbi:MAG: tryptophan synthase subunit alpha [Coriobacteriia bacterium]